MARNSRKQNGPQIMEEGLPDASSSLGSIEGTVTGPSFGALIGKQVTATETETGLKRDVLTNNVGHYEFSLLTPGQYVVATTLDDGSPISDMVTVIAGKITHPAFTRVNEAAPVQTFIVPNPDTNKHTLQVKRLHPDAVLPTVAHPGEDLGYDLFAIETIWIKPGIHTEVKTGIAAHQDGHGLIIKDRSSVAAKGLFLVGGVIDAGYRGELKLIFASNRFDNYKINAGDKIGQMIPVPVLTGNVVEVEELPEAARGDNGFGSSGQ